MQCLIEKIRNLFARKTSPKSSAVGKRVLTIEDDPTQRAMVRKTLEKRGFTVFEASDGKTGIDMCVSHMPDIIILDVILPKMNGHDVCRTIKADAKTKDIPVLFLTSLDSPKDVIDHYEMGGEIHLTKPINPKELIHQVEISLNIQ